MATEVQETLDLEARRLARAVKHVASNVLYVRGGPVTTVVYDCAALPTADGTVMHERRVAVRMGSMTASMILTTDFYEAT